MPRWRPTIRFLRFVSLTGLALALALGASGARAGNGDKELSRVRGSVGFQPDKDAQFKPIFGHQNLADGAFAVTKARSLAVLKLVDSSEIDIGENTIVEVGAFQQASSGQQNNITINNGALHFKIRRPAGGQSNYTFQTPTSQIAVRGTEGFLISGPTGTQVVCTVCTIGDVTVQTGTQTVTLVSGQTLIVNGTASSIGTATQTIVSNAQVNNPAVSQFGSTGTGTVSGNTVSNAIGDTTGSTSGSTIGTATGTTGGITTGQIITTTGAVGGTTAVVAATQQQSTPAPTSTTPALGALTITDPRSTNVYNSFPATINSFANVTLANYYNGANGAFDLSRVQFTGPSASAPQFNITANTPNLVATFGGTVGSAGNYTFSATPPGGSPVSISLPVFGRLTNSTSNPNVTSVSNAAAGSRFTEMFSFSQAAPAGATLGATLTCQTGTVNTNPPYFALNATTIPATGGTFTVTITGAPDYGAAAPPGGPACTLIAFGSGTPAQTLTFTFNISSTGFTVAGHKRKALSGPTPGPTTTPGPIPHATPPGGPRVRPPGQRPL